MQSRPKANLLLNGRFFVGKSKLFYRFINKDTNTRPTLNLDFYLRIVKHRDQSFGINYTDMPGNPKYNEVMEPYVRNQQIFCLLFDVTDRNSFDELPQWYNTDIKYSPEAAFVVIANKIDLTDKRVVTEEEGKDYASSINAQYFEISALNNINVDLLDSYLIELSSSKIFIEERVDLESVQRNDHKKCC